MMRFRFKKVFITGILLIFTAAAYSQEVIKLPAPVQEGGMPLMQALKERKSGREFSSQELSPKTLSNLLWAAWGTNRSDGHRTAPSARNLQDIDVYVAMSNGLYLYDAGNHQLKKILSESKHGRAISTLWANESAIWKDCRMMWGRRSGNWQKKRTVSRRQKAGSTGSIC